jgi:hypothetical protein
MTSFYTYIVRAFQLDLRALALMRIAVALVSLVDLSIRFADVDAFYLSSGIANEELIRSFAAPAFTHTLFFWYSSDAWVYFLFAVHACAALFLLAGYYTQAATFVCWLLLMSEHSRNPLILQGGDDLLRLTLFWAMFLPWGKRYSKDAARYRYEQENTFTGLAAIAYVLQIMYVFFFSAMLKGNEWHTDFSALYFVYHLDQIALPAASYLSQYPYLLKVLTAVAFYTELLTPFLFILPDRRNVFRTAGVIFYVLFHLWNGVTVYIGLFYCIGIATVLGCLPIQAMNFLEKYVPEKLAEVNGTRKPAIMHPYVKWTTDSVWLFLILYVCMWNGSNGNISSYKLTDQARIPGYKLRLDQSWGMFAPAVLKDDGWYIYEAVLYSGDTVDLNRQAQPVSYAKPEQVVKLYRSDRWRKFGELYSLLPYAYIRMYLCKYVQQKWNNVHPENRVKRLRIIYMRETTLPDYRYSKPEPDVLYTCGEDLTQPRQVRNRK